jgi:hypothetical protein
MSRAVTPRPCRASGSKFNPSSEIDLAPGREDAKYEGLLYGTPSTIPNRRLEPALALPSQCYPSKPSCAERNLECGDWSPLSDRTTGRPARRDKSRRKKAPTSRRTPDPFGCGSAALRLDGSARGPTSESGFNRRPRGRTVHRPGLSSRRGTPWNVILIGWMRPCSSNSMRSMQVTR